MIPIAITPNMEACPWTDARATAQANGLGRITRIGRLPRGTTTGKSTITVMIKMPDGREFMAETTMVLFQHAAKALKAADEAEALHERG